MTRSQRHSRLPAIAEPLPPRILLAVTPAGPIVIIKGGTYSGNWQSLDYRVPVIAIRTSEPVIIQNSTLSGRGDLIFASAEHAKVTVRNTTGTAINPNVAGVAPGHFFWADLFDNVDLEDNTLNGTTGIKLVDYRGNHTSAQTVKIIRNVANNIDGRKSNGAGGFMNFNTRTRITTSVSEDGYVIASFAQFDEVIGVPNVEIAWNKVVNQPGNSRVEDNISIYLSSGTKTSPILIHDNYIQGAYTIDPTKKSYSDATYAYDWSYTGGGILLGDGMAGGDRVDPAFTRAYNNTIVSTTNYGVAIAAGHDNTCYNNRVISSGKLPDGRAIAAQNVGMYIWDSYKGGPTHFFNNTAHDNVSGWMQGSVRNDWWAPVAGTFASNTHFAGTITTATEAAELTRWSAALLFSITGTIIGGIFNDLDGDGLREPNESGISGFSVYLDLNHNGVRDANEALAVTGASGQYQFAALTPGSYLVSTVPKTGWRGTLGTAATVNAPMGKIASRSFGFTTKALVSGSIFQDANKNGRRDTGETGLAAWRVFIDANKDGIWNAGETSVLTDASGKYAFSQLSAGSFVIRVVQQAGFAVSAPAAASYTLTLAAGGISSGHDFGEKKS